LFVHHANFTDHTLSLYFKQQVHIGVSYMMMFLLFFMSSLLTGIFRHYALSRNVIDVPNFRSSHSIPTPRGGGIAFVIVFLVVLAYLGFSDQISHWDELGFASAGILVAWLGFIDDHASIPAKWRLIGHFIATGFALYCIGGMVSMVSLGLNISLSNWMLQLLALIYLVWFLNLYNFMDGIDGLAAVEGITIFAGGALIYAMHGYASMMMLPMVLAVVLAGFLLWNFPVAQIFMGDVGSGFLGAMAGLLSIQAAHVQPQFFWCWLILSGVFIVDATVTLLSRMWKGERLYEAHRFHAYQRAVDVFQSHVKITLGVLLINGCWLLPLALLVGAGHLNGVVGVLVAYFPLILLVLLFQSEP
jgi:Fuc2NAc and GlcNAc transferase